MTYKITEYRDKLLFILTHKYDNDTEQAEEATEQLLNFFGLDNRFPDNHLLQKDRLLFNEMRDFGVLKVEREEAKLYNGREWMIYYWKYTNGFLEGRMESEIDTAIAIAELADFAGLLEAHKKIDEEKLVYENIPDEVWNRSTQDKSLASQASPS